MELAHCNKTSWGGTLNMRQRNKKKLRIKARTQIWKQNQGTCQVNQATRSNQERNH